MDVLSVDEALAAALGDRESPPASTRRRDEVNEMQLPIERKTSFSYGGYHRATSDFVAPRSLAANEEPA